MKTKDYLITFKERGEEREVLVKNVTEEEIKNIGDIFYKTTTRNAGDYINLYEYELVSASSYGKVYERKLFKIIA